MPISVKNIWAQKSNSNLHEQKGLNSSCNWNLQGAKLALGMTGFMVSSHVWDNVSFQPTALLSFVLHPQVAATCSRLTFFSSTSTVENPCLLPDSSRKSLVHPPVGPCSGHLLIPPQALGQRLKYSHGPGLDNMFYPEARSGVSPTHSTGIKNKAGCFPERQPTQRPRRILS